MIIKNVFENIEQPLSTVPNHFDIPEIKRFSALGFPIHISVHEITAEEEIDKEYTSLHSHENENEVNIFIPSKGKKLVYKVYLGEDIYTLSGRNSVFIPKGVLHKANCVQGDGVMVCVRY